MSISHTYITFLEKAQREFFLIIIIIPKTFFWQRNVFFYVLDLFPEEVLKFGTYPAIYHHQIHHLPVSKYPPLTKQQGVTLISSDQSTGCYTHLI